jgi:hypothetical protein
MSDCWLWQTDAILWPQLSTCGYRNDWGIASLPVVMLKQRYSATLLCEQEFPFVQYNRPPLIRKLVIWSRLALPANIFLTNCITSCYGLNFSFRLSNTYKELCINVLFVPQYICSVIQPFRIVFSTFKLLMWPIFKEKSNYPDFLDIRMTFRTN